MIHVYDYAPIRVVPGPGFALAGLVCCVVVRGVYTRRLHLASAFMFVCVSPYFVRVCVSVFCVCVCVCMCLCVRGVCMCASLSLSLCLVVMCTYFVVDLLF